MNRSQDLAPEVLPKSQELVDCFYRLAKDYQNDAQVLLLLLRELEKLHQAIRDDFFQAALPTNRRALYQLLRDIETEGGWPFIPRMKLQTLLEHLESQELPPTGDQ